MFDNRRFWDDRYSSKDPLGSGIGSRGDLADLKREIVESEWERAGSGSVLDIGFGDLRVLDPSVFPRYVGVDVSEVAVRTARERFPRHQFVAADFAALLEPDVAPADFVICLDVLIHQTDSRGYRRMIQRVVSRVLAVGLASGYEAEPSAQHMSEICAFHEPISVSLIAAGATAVEAIAEYRGLTLMRFSGPPAGTNGDTSELLT